MSSQLKRITASSPNNVYKITTIETTTPLGANGVFTGPWHDSNADGTNWVDVTIRTDQVGTLIAVQTSDDITNANFTIQVVAVGVSANSTKRIWASIRTRFWRIVFTNGATPETALEITSTATNAVPLLNGGDLASGNAAQPIVFIANDFAGTSTIGDNNPSSQALANSAGQGNFYPLIVGNYNYGGAFSGTPNAALSGWSRARTPTVFRRLTTAAVGPTAIWTPGANNKFRLLKYIIEVTANAQIAAAGVLTISLLDAAADIAQDHQVFVPSAAGTNFQVDDYLTVDLGSFGILSSAANNALNVTLSSALSSGAVNIIVMGTEE